MTPGLFKLLLGLGASILVGCAMPPQTAQTLPADVTRPPRADAYPATQLAPAQPVAPVAGDRGAPDGDAPQVPGADGVAWKQRGLASWYGRRFNGRRTASGERFSASGFTAAHRTLPIPSYVRVRRLDNDAQVIVRINDRGPFHPGRVVDLSFAAASTLGIVALGNAEVEMELATEDEWCAATNKKCRK